MLPEVPLPFESPYMAMGSSLRSLGALHPLDPCGSHDEQRCEDEQEPERGSAACPGVLGAGLAAGRPPSSAAQLHGVLLLGKVEAPGEGFAALLSNGQCFSLGRTFACCRFASPRSSP